jgi:hypothetical protein
MLHVYGRHTTFYRLHCNVTFIDWHILTYLSTIAKVHKSIYPVYFAEEVETCCERKTLFQLKKNIKKIKIIREADRDHTCIKRTTGDYKVHGQDDDTGIVTLRYRLEELREAPAPVLFIHCSTKPAKLEIVALPAPPFFGFFSVHFVSRFPKLLLLQCATA